VGPAELVQYLTTATFKAALQHLKKKSQNLQHLIFEKWLQNLSRFQRSTSLSPLKQSMMTTMQEI